MRSGAPGVGYRGKRIPLMKICNSLPRAWIRTASGGLRSSAGWASNTSQAATSAAAKPPTEPSQTQSLSKVLMRRVDFNNTDKPFAVGH